MKREIPDVRPFYGGKHNDSLDNGYFNSINPANEECITKIPISGSNDVDAAVMSSHEAFKVGMK